MHDIDKQVFAAFLAELRKEQGWTQKELAEKLFVSDKAVSKWERALSLPDISLLIPLADALGITVTELLEGKRMEKPESKSPEQVEVLLKKTLRLTEEEPGMTKEKKKRCWIFGGALVLVMLEWIITGGIPYEELNVLEGLSIGFGFYFWTLVQEKLPEYYDTNRIGTYSHGPVRMNIPGVRFTNENWPHIVRTLQIWTLVTMLTVPLAAMVLEFRGLRLAVFAGYLASMVICLYRVGRKYEKG